MGVSFLLYQVGPEIKLIQSGLAASALPFSPSPSLLSFLLSPSPLLPLYFFVWHMDVCELVGALEDISAFVCGMQKLTGRSHYHSFYFILKQGFLFNLQLIVLAKLTGFCLSPFCQRRGLGHTTLCRELGFHEWFLGL